MRHKVVTQDSWHYGPSEPWYTCVCYFLRIFTSCHSCPHFHRPDICLCGGVIFFYRQSVIRCGQANHGPGPELLFFVRYSFEGEEVNERVKEREGRRHTYVLKHIFYSRGAHATEVPMKYFKNYRKIISKFTVKYFQLFRSFSQIFYKYFRFLQHIRLH